jgi:hypothetical protein
MIAARSTGLNAVAATDGWATFTLDAANEASGTGAAAWGAAAGDGDEAVAAGAAAAGAAVNVAAGLTA